MLKSDLLICIIEDWFGIVYDLVAPVSDCVCGGVYLVLSTSTSADGWMESHSISCRSPSR